MPRSLGRNLVSIPLVTRRRWRAEDARSVVERLEASGLSVHEFAAREKINAQRLYRWRARLGSGEAQRPAFVEIKAATELAIEVVLRSGHVVRVPPGFCEDDVRRLIAVLEGGQPQC